MCDEFKGGAREEGRGGEGGATNPLTPPKLS